MYLWKYTLTFSVDMPCCFKAAEYDRHLLYFPQVRLFFNMIGCLVVQGDFSDLIDVSLRITLNSYILQTGLISFLSIHIWHAVMEWNTTLLLEDKCLAFRMYVVYCMINYVKVRRGGENICFTHFPYISITLGFVLS